MQKKLDGGTILAGVLGVLAVCAVVFAALMLMPLFTSGATTADKPAEAPKAAETVKAAPPAPKGKLKLYEGPKSMKTSEKAVIRANGNKLFVYDSAVNPARENKGNYDVSTVTTTPMTYFDLISGSVDIEIEVLDTKSVEKLESATVSPLALGITPVISGRKVKFTIDKPGQYTVQFNGSAKLAAHIFVNPEEKDIPDKNDENVIWVDPGEYNIENVKLESGQTLYLSGGAVMHGTVSASFAKNVSIRGRGIIDGSNWDTWRGQEAHVPVDLQNCTDFYAEGIILNNSNAWCFNIFNSARGNVDNVKIISARPNGDGFTLQSCENVTVQNGFSRTWDDSLVVKNYDGNTKNITFKNMQVWTDLAQSCEIGYETNKGRKANSRIENVTFEDITVINNFHKPVLSIHNSDDALVTNITYKNITVENAAMGLGDAINNAQLIDLTIASSTWNSTKTRGVTNNIKFENITVLKHTLPVTLRFNGYDAEHMVSDVSITNLVVDGQRITDFSQLGKVVKTNSANLSIK